MCVSILHRGRHLSTIGDLRAAIAPVKPVIRGDYRLPMRDQDCLCPVQLASTDWRVGCKARPMPDADQMTIVFVPFAKISDGSWDREAAEAKRKADADWRRILDRVAATRAKPDVKTDVDEDASDDANALLRADPRDPAPPADGIMDVEAFA